jgi:hypothetical protein
MDERGNWLKGMQTHIQQAVEHEIRRKEHHIEIPEEEEDRNLRRIFQWGTMKVSDRKSLDAAKAEAKAEAKGREGREGRERSLTLDSLGRSEWCCFRPAANIHYLASSFFVSICFAHRFCFGVWQRLSSSFTIEQR